MRILDLVLKQGLRSLAIVGITKNVGKTVTLNYILQQAFQEGYRLGVASMGRDGEKVDILTRQAKPRIDVPPGALVVTAEGALPNSRALLYPLERTDIYTPLGEVFLYEVRRAGNVELVGPRTQMQMQRVVDLLVQRSDLVLLDGAINRVLSASPSVTDGTILAVGASLSRSLPRIVERSLYQVETLTLPAVPESFLKARIFTELKEMKAAVMDAQKRWHQLDISTSFKLGPLLERMLNAGTRKLYLGGALTDNIIKAVLAKDFLKKGEIIIRDGTKIFIDPMLWRRFHLGGGRISVLEAINLIALTANPRAPERYYFEPWDFVNALAQSVIDYPVLDPVAGIGRWGSQEIMLAN